MLIRPRQPTARSGKLGLSAMVNHKKSVSHDTHWSGVILPTSAWPAHWRPRCLTREACSSTGL